MGKPRNQTEYRSPDRQGRERGGGAHRPDTVSGTQPDVVCNGPALDCSNLRRREGRRDGQADRGGKGRKHTS